MTIENAWVPVSTTPVLIADGGNNGLKVNVKNAGTPTVYLGGGTAVSGTTGASLLINERLAMTLEQSETLYAVAASGTATLEVLKSGS